MLIEQVLCRDTSEEVNFDDISVAEKAKLEYEFFNEGVFPPVLCAVKDTCFLVMKPQDKI